MIEFGSWHYIDADQVESISMDDYTGSDYPYRIIVRMKSGKECSVNYKDKNARAEEAKRVAKCVELELGKWPREIYSHICCLEEKVRIMDVRQLRIWRLLKKLVNGKVGDDDAED